MRKWLSALALAGVCAACGGSGSIRAPADEAKTEAAGSGREEGSSGS